MNTKEEFLDKANKTRKGIMAQLNQKHIKYDIMHIVRSDIMIKLEQYRDTWLAEKMNDLIPRLSAGILDELYTALLTGLYLGYDDDRDFLDQFTENTHKIILMLELLKQIDSLGKSDHHT